MYRYEIVFSGQRVEGAQLERVKANLGKLFQADEQRLALLFSGRRLVLKNNLDAATAEKYRATLERAGAQVDVVAMQTAGSEPLEEIELAAPPHASDWLRSTPAGSGRLQITPRDACMAAFTEVDAPDYSLADAGSDLLAPGVKPAPPALDLSGLSIAPVGSDMGQISVPEVGSVPDISHLKLL